ncbi:MAG: TusE/DsrC/DsvC family sulfur relay protein [Actinomycetota bacterium]
MKPKRYEGIVPVAPHHLRTVTVNGRELATDAEGYLVDRSQWSEDFARALAGAHRLTLTPEHWLVISFIRNHWRTRGRTASLREMVRHFRGVWGRDKGSVGYLFHLFEAGGGPVKFGNRLAGVPRVAGDA